MTTKLRGSRTRLCLLLLFIAPAIHFGGSYASAQTIRNWTFKILDDNDPSAKAGTTSAGGINDDGTVVGNYLVGSSNYWIYGFAYTGTYGNIVVNPTGCTNACNTLPNGINSSEQIAGEYDDPSFNQHAFYGANGQYNAFDFPGAAYTIASGISNKGAIVGFYQESSGADERDPSWGLNVNGFVYTPGLNQPSELNLPGCAETELFGINSAGTVVGNCPGSAATTKNYGIAYNPATGSVTNLIVPGSQFTHAYAINDAGQVVGVYFDGITSHCFLYSAGIYALIPDPPGATSTSCGGVNNAAQVVGTYLDSQGASHGFIASGPELLDPVPSGSDLGLMTGPAVSSNTILQVTGMDGRPITGVAADGVTEAVVRIPAAHVGDQFTITLQNDQSETSTSAQSDGAVGSPDDGSYPTQSSVTVSAISVTAVDGSQSPYAFAVYRAPVDFVRQNSDGSYEAGTQHYFSVSTGFGPPCGGPWPPCVVTAGLYAGTSATDDQLASRGVNLQVQDLSSGNTFSMPVEILRPPIVMIHGLWNSWKAWNDFNPLMNGPDGADARFYIGRVDYSWNVGSSITGSDPAYPADVLKKASANSLGFAYNAPFALSDINGWIGNFKSGSNPLGIPAAAVQADIIGHSMGGDITRTIALQPTFLADSTFGQGNIHKLITIDTPHLGSPLANDLLSSQERGGCVEGMLASHGNLAFNVVQFPWSPINGAVADLSTGSSVLALIRDTVTKPIPTALIAGVNPNFDFFPPFISGFCTLAADNLAAADVSGSKWAQTIFANQPNDAIVSETSQLDGLNSQFVFSGVDHSLGVEGFFGLGFAGPNVLSPDSKTGIPSTVIKILNTIVTSSAFFSLNP